MATKAELEAEADGLFAAIGLTGTTKDNAVKSAKLRPSLVEVIKEAGVGESGCPKATGALLCTVAQKYPNNAISHRPVLLGLVVGGGIKSNAQLEAALRFLGSLGADELDVTALEQASGVGVVVSATETTRTVAEVIEANAARVDAERYRVSANMLLADVRKKHPWVDVGVARAELDAQLAARLGPRTPEDDAPLDKKAKQKARAKAEASKGDDGVGEADPRAASRDVPSGPPRPSSLPPAVSVNQTQSHDPFAFLPKPEENNGVHTTVRFSDGTRMDIANTKELLQKHLAATGGRVITRFPPEPNGYLHIGHAKAMFVDFGMAKAKGGECLLRFDDTNPEAEKLEYIEHIQEIVRWLGWEPSHVTYSSDYFPQLYEFAMQLIREGNAYVCHQTGEEIKASRERREPSPWRDRPVEESLKIFEDMRRGLVEEGKATLRMRQDHKNDNGNMFDLVAYRIKFAPHPHAGDKWCVYPSYDFTHCLVDALENITHSMCTLEFDTRRASYFWLLQVLGTYKPVVWEYSRLNITNTVLSKRRLHRLVHDGYVSGWDDPRLFTLAGLRRRGVTPTAINSFCADLGVTRSEGEVTGHRLDAAVRADLDVTSPRRLAVLRPLRMVLTNYDPEIDPVSVPGRAFPGRTDETYSLPASNVVYIEASDFRDQDTKGYFGLAPGKEALLRYAFVIRCTRAVVGQDGTLSHLEAEMVRPLAGTKPPKGVLGWVSGGAEAARDLGIEPLGDPTPPTHLEARLYNPLFTSQSPASSDTWLEELNPESLEVVSGALGCCALAGSKPGDRFQLERLGYFAVDPDAAEGLLIVNRTVTLRESLPREAKDGKK